jgi:hypothetical protein
MAELLGRIRAEIGARLDESRAAVDEYERLEAALAALGGPITARRLKPPDPEPRAVAASAEATADAPPPEAPAPAAVEAAPAHLAEVPPPAKPAQAEAGESPDAAAAA